jgi:hypothetical protein
MIWKKLPSRVARPLALKNRQEYRGCTHVWSWGPDMKCASILSLAILLTGTCAFSQEPVTGSTANLVLATPPLRMHRTNCPVGLQVKHGPGLPMSRAAGPTINGKPLNPQAQIPDQNQGIHLTLINLMPRSIVSAQFVVHGFSNKWRYVPLSGADPDLARTVEVALDVKGNGEASRNLSLSHFTAITAVDVNAVTYGDGSTWRTSSPGACSVSPDLFMLVNAEQ